MSKFHPLQTNDAMPKTAERVELPNGCFALKHGKFSHYIHMPHRVTDIGRIYSSEVQAFALAMFQQNCPAQAVIETLVEALEPFAKLNMPKEAPDDAMVCVTSLNGGMVDVGPDFRLTVGTIRKARAALVKARAGGR